MHTPELPNLDRLQPPSYSNGSGNVPRLPDRVVDTLIDSAGVSRLAYDDKDQTVAVERLVHDTCEELLARLPDARRAQPEGEAPQAAAICDRLAAMMEQGAGELKPGERLRQAARMIRELPAAQHAESGAQAMIPTWQERSGMREFMMPKDAAPHMVAEIRDLRAALAAQSQGAQAAGWQAVPTSPAVAQGMWGHMELALRRAMTDTGYNEPTDIAAAKQWNGNATHVVRSIIAAAARHAEKWPNAAQQAAAPGALDADEMTRLRRLMRALGMADDGGNDEYVRGILFTVLSQAAGQIERATSAPGTPEAPKGGA